jgi:glycine dehydrogenase
VLLQYPGVNGDVRDYRALAEAIHAAGGHVVAAADLLALTVLTPPGEWGADVAVGNTQRFGVPVGFGGPHAAYLAVRDEFKRQMPGRLVGVTVDAQGKPALRLALQTREQHIRREKATSNVCTAQALLAIMASMYAVYHGPQGLKTIAQRVNRITALLAAGAKKLGYTLVNENFFDTLTFETGARTQALHDAAVAKRINLRRVSDTRVGISIDETTKRSDLADLLAVFAQAAFVSEVPQIDALDAELPAESTVPVALERTSAYLTHHVFNRHHSETEMLRYLRSLSDKDLALDRSMIPLGSCTMKLNATSEMLPVTWPEFGQIHPFAPAEQTVGYREMIDQLEADAGGGNRLRSRLAATERRLARRVRGSADHPRLSRVARRRSSQCLPDSRFGARHEPGVGTDGRHAGRGGRVRCTRQRRYRRPEGEGRTTRGQARRDHDHVSVDARRVRSERARNLRDRACARRPGLRGRRQHERDGRPHGAGSVRRRRLAPEPAQDVLHSARRWRPGRRSGGGGRTSRSSCRIRFRPAMSARRWHRRSFRAPYGSASILPISWMYIAMMGAKNLTAATETAILNANYVANKLAPHYPVLYSGPGGLVAHECILDLRPIKETSGITVDDVAKRLADYGFHAPTMSFPVPGTLMVEPTESESKEELDRFIEAMIAIREEIRAVEEGRSDREDNPLKHAPHTAAVVIATTGSMRMRVKPPRIRCRH